MASTFPLNSDRGPPSSPPARWSLSNRASRDLSLRTSYIEKVFFFKTIISPVLRTYCIVVPDEIVVDHFRVIDLFFLLKKGLTNLKLLYYQYSNILLAHRFITICIVSYNILKALRSTV